MTSKFYAAHDAGTIYGIGESTDNAIEDAERWIDGHIEDLDVTEISETLFYQIERQGWDGWRQSFEISNGELFETTDD